MVSAKTGQGVREVFEELTASCIKQFGKIDNESKNRMAVVEDIRKKKADFKLKTGNETKKKACC